MRVIKIIDAGSIEIIDGVSLVVMDRALQVPVASSLFRSCKMATSVGNSRV